MDESDIEFFRSELGDLESLSDIWQNWLDRHPADFRAEYGLGLDRNSELHVQIFDLFESKMRALSLESAVNFGYASGYRVILKRLQAQLGYENTDIEPFEWSDTLPDEMQSFVKGFSRVAGFQLGWELAAMSLAEDLTSPGGVTALEDESESETSEMAYPALPMELTQLFSHF